MIKGNFGKHQQPCLLFPVNKKVLYLLVFFLMQCTALCAQYNFIRTDPVTRRYFINGLGKSWVPVEINLLIFNNQNPNNPDAFFEKYERIFAKFSANNGNAIRLWWGPGNQFEIEDGVPGNFTLNKLNDLDRFLALAKKYNLRVKMCMSVSRSFFGSGSFAKPSLYAKNGGPLNSFADYLNSNKGIKIYMNRLKVYLDRYKNNPTVYCWEIWNEIDAVSEGDWWTFSKQVIDSVKKYAPNQLCTVSMGSFDSDRAEADYLKYFKLTNNDITLVHSYLDPGAPKLINRGAPDVFLNNAVSFAYRNTILNPKPVFVNETGAVQAKHTGDSPLYDKDRLGLLAHDMIFAPFFSGAAGPGSLWHEWAYTDKLNLWYHYNRFYNATRDCDPVKQKYVPLFIKAGSVNAYVLKGRTETIIWCKNSLANTIATLENGQPAVKTTTNYLPQSKLIAKGRSIKKILSYDPWLDKWNTLAIPKSNVLIPPFTRTIVLKIYY